MPTKIGQRPPGTQVGKIAGVPIRLNPSWPISMVLVIAVIALLSDRLLPDRNLVITAGSAVILTLLLLASVLLHEIGHVVVARRLGQPVLQVKFDVLGGQTELGADRSSPGKDALVAAAGPVVSALCAGAGFGTAALLPHDSGPWLVAATLGVINALLAVFNLLPALPLDGGEIVRAIAWRITGDRRKAATVGYLAGFGICLVLAALAVLSFVAHRRVQAVILGVLSIHLAAVAAQEWRAERRAETSAATDWRPAPSLRVLARPLLTVSSTATMAAVPLAQGEVAAVDVNGAVIGILDRNRAAVLAPDSPVTMVTRPQDAGAVLFPDDEPAAIAEALQRTSSSTYILVDADGEPIGILLRSDLAAIVADRS